MARKLRCHPRTLARALARDVSASWTPNINPVIDVNTVARRLRCAPARLRRVLIGRDVMLDQDEAAAMVGIASRSFRDAKAYTPAIKVRGIVRYSRFEIEHTRALNLIDLHRLMKQPRPQQA